MGSIAALTHPPDIRMLPGPLELEPLWLRLAGLPGTSPKVWMDAHLAALTIRHEAEFVTLDRHFRNVGKDGLKLRLLSA